MEHNKEISRKDISNFVNKVNPRFADFVTRVADEAWGEPLIDHRTKTLITIAIDVVNQGVYPGSPFRVHLEMAEKLGITREEVEEVLKFCCVYAGFNKCFAAFNALQDFYDK